MTLFFSPSCSFYGRRQQLMSIAQYTKYLQIHQLASHEIKGMTNSSSPARSTPPPTRSTGRTLAMVAQEHRVRINHSGFFQNHRARINHSGFSQQHRARINHSGFFQRHRVRINHSGRWTTDHFEQDTLEERPDKSTRCSAQLHTCLYIIMKLDLHVPRMALLRWFEWDGSRISKAKAQKATTRPKRLILLCSFR